MLKSKSLGTRLASVLVAGLCSLVLTPVLAAPIATAPSKPSAIGAEKHLLADWAVLEPPELSFSVRMPAPAEHTSVDNLAGKTNSWICKYGETIYQVGANKFSTFAITTASSENGREGILNGMVKSFFQNVAAQSGTKVEQLTLISEEPLSGCITKSYNYLIRRSDGSPELSGQSIFYVNEHFSYIFSVISRQEIPAALSEAFFSSIKISSTSPN